MGYDLGRLKEKLKSKSLPVLEDTVEQVVEAVFEWVAEEAVLSENKLDDLLLPLLPLIKGMAVKAVDKIDGKEG